MSGNANSGRRPAPPVDVQALELLTVPQALVLLRLKGRPMSRKKLLNQVAVGRLPVLVDYLHLDNHNHPRYLIERPALERWLRASLVPLKVARIAS